jgi:formylglycine-generating enzyme required for sulfatase activity
MMTEKPADPLEAGFWETIKDSQNVADFQAYLDSYPEGQFAALARDRLAKLALGFPQKPALEPAVRGLATTVKDCAQCPELVLIGAGTFMMGSAELFDFEAPVHPVTIDKPFYIGRSEVTFD